MIRQYRLERFNGVEMLVSEVFRKHTWTQSEYKAWRDWIDHEEKVRPGEVHPQSAFRADLNDFLSSLKPGEDTKYYGLSEPIPVYDVFPHVILRGVVVADRIASLQVEYTADMLPCEIQSEIRTFYEVMDSRHWRDTVSHQIEKYGTLFTSPDDKESE